ncbi:hypothetical protein Golax_007060 [Gossypium laxum]|uniref:Uncharacterized protein n=1 Tax=Gossypium laxum TaxID=34288 RepID=A0A7J9A5X7_9ROSI|nr:hypothetical protein [Gossypium laxum]
MPAISGQLNYYQKLESSSRVPYFKSIMIFLPWVPTILLGEGMNRKKRYLSHLFQRMEKRSPFECLLERLC